MKRLKFLLLIPLLFASACSGKNKLNDKKLVIGCSPTPHAEILEAARPLFKEKGYELDIKIINDYVTPNSLLNSSDLDANYFQHVPYLNDYNEKNNTSLSWIVKVHFEPMGIYSLKHTGLNVENPKIAIPNDTSNEIRAVELLNSYNVVGTIVEAEASSLPSLLQDVDYAVINGNYALSANIVDKCIVTESKTSKVAIENANVVAVKASSLNYEWVDVIKEVMTSVEIGNFINERYGSTVIPVF